MNKLISNFAHLLVTQLHIFIALFVISVLSSCAMNKAFVKPFPLPEKTKSITLRKNAADSLVITFSGREHHPVFKQFEQAAFGDIDFKGVYFVNERGDSLHGYILQSKTVKPLNINVVHFRGAANNLMLTQFQSIVPLVQQGFTFLIFDYAGYGFSGGYAKRKGLIADGIAAIRFMKNYAGNNGKLIAYGQSFGGNLAVAVAAKTQDVLDGLVTEGAFSSHKDMAAVGSGMMGRLWVREIYSAKSSIRSFKKPYLLVHSKEDETVPFTMAHKIYDRANQPKMMLEITGKHLEGQKNYAVSIAERIVGMVK